MENRGFTKGLIGWFQQDVLHGGGDMLTVRQPCRHVPKVGFRPVALRPALSSGLPFSNGLYIGRYEYEL